MRNDLIVFVVTTYQIRVPLSINERVHNVLEKSARE